MSSLRDLLSRVRRWRLWRSLHLAPAATATVLPPYFATSRPIRRDVTPNGVRVYSLCGHCGVHLNASATLCDACARSRSLPNS